MGAAAVVSPLEQGLSQHPNLFVAVRRLALKRFPIEAEAEDFACTAIEKAIEKSRETGKPQPPPDPPRLYLLYVGSFVNTQVSNAFRAEKRHPRVDVDPADEKRGLRGATSDAASVLEEMHHEERRVPRMLSEVRAWLAAEPERDAVPLQVLDWVEQGVGDSEELARNIGCSPDDISKARRRLRDVGKLVKARVLAEEEAQAPQEKAS